MNTSAAASLILNVDDNDGARYAKSRILRNAGFKVEEAANGADALAFVRERLPDLVLLDVKLPDINGIEVCRRIKGEPASAAVLVLQTSAALTGIADKVRGLDGGADNYLAAPIEAEELVANVNALLRMRSIQKQLRNSEERFRELAENIDDVFWISALGEPAILYLSPAYETMWGRSAAALEDNPEDWLEAVHPDDRSDIAERFRAIAGECTYDAEYRLLLPDGTVRWLRDRTYPIRNSHDVIYRIARISSDISSRKEAERMLQEADSRKNEFLATLAHELRNPLGPIRNGINLLERLGDGHDEMRARTRQIIARQADHLTHLVDDLLDIARIAQGKIALRKEEVELATFVSAAVETASAFIEERGHTLRTDLPARRIWLMGDPVRLAQSLDNLLHNAAKFTSQGGIITLKAELERQKVRITVTDNGIGIAPQDIEHIFGLFSQGAVAPDRAQDGLGIGLSLVQRLIEMQDGRISVSSPGLGGGSTFTIELPVTRMEERRAEERKASAPAPAAITPGGRRILLVDDNIDAVSVMQMLLEELGYQTYIAHDPDTGLALAREHRPDVALLDIGLPGKDGYEVARILRREPGLEHVKLIALTGYGLEHDKARARDAGFDHHLVKPADFDMLLQVIAG